MKKRQTIKKLIIILALMVITMTNKGEIDYQYSYISKINANYFKAKIVTTQNCSIQPQYLPSGWIALREIIYIPNTYATDHINQQFTIGVRLTCPQFQDRLEIVIQNIEGYLVLHKAKQQKQNKQTIQIEGFEQETILNLQKLHSEILMRKQEQSDIDQLFDEVMRLQTPSAPDIKIQKTIGTGQVYPLNNNITKIDSIEQLPSVPQMKQFINTNDSYSISVTIQNVLNSDLKCTEKATYLQQFSGYIDVHLNRLELNITQAGVVISEAQKQGNRIKQQIVLKQKQLQNLNMDSLQLQLNIKMGQLQTAYSIQRQKYQYLDQLIKTLQWIRQIKQEIEGQMLNKTSSELIRQKMANISIKYPQVKIQISDNSTISDLSIQIDKMEGLLQESVDRQNRVQDKLRINSLQLEIDVERVMISLKNARQKQKIIFDDLKTLRQRLFNAQTLASSFRRVLAPLGGEIAQISIYQRTIDEQLDLVYFHCFNVTSISTQDIDQRVIQITEIELKAYLQTVYQVEQPTKQPVTEQRNNLKKQIQSSLEEVQVEGEEKINKKENIVDRLPQILNQTQKQVGMSQKQIGDTVGDAKDEIVEKKVVQITRTSVGDQKWMQKYGVFNINKTFSCIETSTQKTGSGIIKVIYKDIIVVQTNDRKNLYLKVSPCTRIQAVGSKLPQIGQRIYWRGQVKAVEIQTTGLATL